MAGPKRSPEQRAADMADIGRLAIQGKTVRQIAGLLNQRDRAYTIGPTQVHYDLKKIERAWIESAQADIRIRGARELAGLDLQEAELWRAWEKSKQEAETKSVKQNEGGGKKPGTTKTLTKEGQCGDPAYMRLILEVRDRRAKLLGLDAPVKQDLSGLPNNVLIVLPTNGRDQPEPPVIDVGGNGGNGSGPPPELGPKQG